MTDKNTPTLIEGKDFYFNEQGLMVLTKSYHLKRGHCCHSGCKHCPYEHTENFDPDIPSELHNFEPTDQQRAEELLKKYED